MDIIAFSWVRKGVIEGFSKIRGIVLGPCIEDLSCWGVCQGGLRV